MYLKSLEMLGFKSFAEAGSSFRMASRPSSGQTGAAKVMWWMPFSGCWVSKAPRRCAARRWKT